MAYNIYIGVLGVLCAFFVIGILIWSQFKPVSNLLKLIDSFASLIMYICLIYNEEEKWIYVLFVILFNYLLLFNFFPRLSIYLSDISIQQ